MWIKANHEKIRYTGRIDWSRPEEPLWVYPCTSAEFRFTGSVLKIYVQNYHLYWQNYLGCIIDHVQTCHYLNNNGGLVIEIPVPENPTGVHQVLFFKRQDSCHELSILGFEIGNGERLLDLPPLTNRRIEVYGDSVSAGEVSEAVDHVGQKDPEHNGGYSNSWYSYAWMTARKLNAQIHDIAQGGIALMNGTGCFLGNQLIGMETAWDKINYNPFLGKMTKWDFSQYQPQVVIVAVAQNDSYPVKFMAENHDNPQARKWKQTYFTLLMNLRNKYPDAYIICCTTLLKHTPAWDQAISEVVAAARDERISQYLFRRNGCGTPGHLRIPEAYEMAEELTKYIQTLDIKGWETDEKN